MIYIRYVLMVWVFEPFSIDYICWKQNIIIHIQSYGVFPKTFQQKYESKWFNSYNYIVRTTTTCILSSNLKKRKRKLGWSRRHVCNMWHIMSMEVEGPRERKRHKHKCLMDLSKWENRWASFRQWSVRFFAGGDSSFQSTSVSFTFSFDIFRVNLLNGYPIPFVLFKLGKHHQFVLLGKYRWK